MIKTAITVVKGSERTDIEASKDCKAQVIYMREGEYIVCCAGKEFPSPCVVVETLYQAIGWGAHVVRSEDELDDYMTAESTSQELPIGLANKKEAIGKAKDWLLKNWSGVEPEGGAYSLQGRAYIAGQKQLQQMESPVRELPKVKIGGKLYFRDDRLEEFRSVDRPSDKPIKFEELGAHATGKEVRAIFRPQRSAVK